MKKRVHNPLSYDFSYPWCDDNNEEHTLTIPALGTASFDEPVALFMGKHLIDQIILEKGYRNNVYDEAERLKDEVFL